MTSNFIGRYKLSVVKNQLLYNLH